MASSANTWQKKLVERDRRAVRKIKGIKPRFAVDARPVSTKPKHDDKRNALPMRVGWAPRRHKGKAAAAAAAAILEAKAARDAKFRALVAAVAGLAE